MTGKGNEEEFRLALFKAVVDAATPESGEAFQQSLTAENIDEIAGRLQKSPAFNDARLSKKVLARLVKEVRIAFARTKVLAQHGVNHNIKDNLLHEMKVVFPPGTADQFLAQQAEHVLSNIIANETSSSDGEDAADTSTQEDAAPAEEEGDDMSVEEDLASGDAVATVVAPVEEDAAPAEEEGDDMSVEEDPTLGGAATAVVAPVEDDTPPAEEEGDDMLVEEAPTSGGAAAAVLVQAGTAYPEETLPQDPLDGAVAGDVPVREGSSFGAGAAAMVPAQEDPVPGGAVAGDVPVREGSPSGAGAAVAVPAQEDPVPGGAAANDVPVREGSSSGAGAAATVPAQEDPVPGGAAANDVPAREGSSSGAGAAEKIAFSGASAAEKITFFQNPVTGYCLLKVPGRGAGGGPAIFVGDRKEVLATAVSLNFLSDIMATILLQDVYSPRPEKSSA